MKPNMSMVMSIKNLEWRMADRIERWQRSSIAFVYAGCAALEPVQSRFTLLEDQ